MSSECFNWLELASIQVVGACIGPWRVVRNCVYSRSCMYSKLSSMRHKRFNKTTAHNTFKVNDWSLSKESLKSKLYHYLLGSYLHGFCCSPYPWIKLSLNICKLSSYDRKINVMDKIWNRKSFKVRGPWLLWREWKTPNDDAEPTKVER